MLETPKLRYGCAMQNDSKFEDTMYVTAFLYARDGMSDEQIGKALGVSGPTFRRWCANNDALADAVSRGREVIDGQDAMTFPEYVYRHLSPHLRELWDEINECVELENGFERVEALLRKGGQHARQHLFIHALASSCFNVSASMRKLNVSRKTYDHWRTSDPGFAELLDEMHWHKKNFFEAAFIGRVAAGDTAAILHAVKSQLADRGYSDKLQVEHSGTVEHRHTVDIAELDLPLEVLVAIRDAVRVKKERDENALATRNATLTHSLS